MDGDHAGRPANGPAWRRASASDRGAGHNQFDAPVLLTPGGVVVGGHWLALTEPGGADDTLRHAVAHEEVLNRLCPLLGKPLIEVSGADAVGVPFHRNPEAGM